MVLLEGNRAWSVGRGEGAGVGGETAFKASWIGIAASGGGVSGRIDVKSGGVELISSPGLVVSPFVFACFHVGLAACDSR